MPPCPLVPGSLCPLTKLGVCVCVPLFLLYGSLGRERQDPSLCLSLSSLLSPGPSCGCLPPLPTLLISPPSVPLTSFVYISKTLVQVKHGFLINTFPLIAGKKNPPEQQILCSGDQ